MQTSTLTAITLTVALGACSSMPERNSDLDRAQGRFNVAQRDNQVATLAPDELSQASDAMNKARAAFDNRSPKSTIDHLSYLAAQRVIIAQETASIRASQAITAGAGAERDKMRLSQRTAEVDRARQQLAVSEQQSANKSAELLQADAATQREQARAQSSNARANALELQLQQLNAKNTERGLIVTLGDVLFDSGQARLRPEAAGHMMQLAQAFQRNTDLKASIEGYTDSVGSTTANLDLSDRRARAVRTMLTNLGVRPDQLSSQGLGENNPVGSNETSAGRQMNRRVEIVFGSASSTMVVK